MWTIIFFHFFMIKSPPPGYVGTFVSFFPSETFLVSFFVCSLPEHLSNVANEFSSTFALTILNLFI